MNALKSPGSPPTHAKKAPKNRPSEISPARRAAFDVLLAVERGPSHSDDLLRGKAVNALSAPDRNLATALVLGVLRWQIRLDHEIHALLSRPNARLEPEVRIALRLGAFQLLHLDRIPARAVLSESVELAKQAGHRFASGMVNAVLRKMGAGASRSDFSEQSAAELALAQAHPSWMVERWASFYGLDAARAICRHGQSQPVLAVRLATPAVETELVQAGVVLEAGELLRAARTVAAGEITATEAFREGRVRLQDEGSQLVAELACANLNQKARSVLDACAAPGGKTLILAERNPQARIVACESSAPRLEQLRKRLALLGERVESRLADATALAEEAAFDLALADVPCSGTGTLGRNPEIRHRLRPDDLARQAERQRAILSAALRAVRPGGRVVYSTCSLEPEENEQVVAAVLAENPNARPVSLGLRIDALLGAEILTPSGAQRLRECLTPEGALRLLPGRFHTDGFFICMIERTA
jgi:16S rRNA (cytosine967-C5)-methyltransferase